MKIFTIGFALFFIGCIPICECVDSKSDKCKPIKEVESEDPDVKIELLKGVNPKPTQEGWYAVRDFKEGSRDKMVWVLGVFDSKKGLVVYDPENSKRIREVDDYVWLGRVVFIGE